MRRIFVLFNLIDNTVGVSLLVCNYTNTPNGRQRGRKRNEREKKATTTHQLNKDPAKFAHLILQTVTHRVNIVCTWVTLRLLSILFCFSYLLFFFASMLLCTAVSNARLFSTSFIVNGILPVIWILCMQCVRWHRLAIAIIVIVYGKTHEIMGEFSFSFSIHVWNFFLFFFVPSFCNILYGCRFCCAKKLPPLSRIVRCYFFFFSLLSFRLCQYSFLFMVERFLPISRDAFIKSNFEKERVERRGSFHEHCNSIP